MLGFISFSPTYGPLKGSLKLEQNVGKKTLNTDEREVKQGNVTITNCYIGHSRSAIVLSDGVAVHASNMIVHNSEQVIELREQFKKGRNVGKVTITNSIFSNTRKAISVPHDAEVNADYNMVFDSEEFIELRDPPDLIHKLGLAEDTPPEIIKALLEKLILPENHNATAVKEIAESNGIMKWLPVVARTAASTEKLISALIALQQSGVIQQLLRLFH
jgi:hypothetical protein